MGVADSPSLGRPYGKRFYEPISDGLARLERKSWAFIILLLVPLAYLGLFYALPILILVARSFFHYNAETQVTGGFTLDNYAHFLRDPAYLAVLWSSIRIGLSVTALDLVIGYPVAYLLARVSGLKKQVIMACVVSPMLVSIVIRTFSWQVLLRGSGPVSRILMAAHIIQQPLQVLNTETAVIIALVHVYLPFLIMPLSTVIESIDPTLELAASSLGANNLRRFVEVVFPLSIPGVAAGSLLVLTTSVSAYVTPAMLSGGRFLVMPTLVAQQMQVLVDWSFGSAIAVILIAVVLAISALFSWWADAATKYRSR